MQLVNIALGKPAVQSALSEWSTDIGARGLVNGDFAQNFGIVTELQDAPWWRVDLIDSLPLEAIIIHNRRDGLQDAARTLKIGISDDAIGWTTIHSGISHFGDRSNGVPLNIPLGSKVWARYVRLSLTERAHLHLSQVEILADASKIKMTQIREAHHLDIAFPGEKAGIGFYEGYSTKSATGRFAGPLIGLEINESGAFGNCVIQYLNVILIAKRLGLRYVRTAKNDRSGFVRLRHSVEISGITFLPADGALPSGGVFLSGYFFDRTPFNHVIGDISSAESHVIVKDYIKRLFDIDTKSIEHKCSDELLIHIRSGDIFASWVHPDYVQPPLSFYTAIVNRLIDNGVVTRVKLIFENRLNPVIDHLESFLSAERIPYSIQSGSIREDVQALVNGRYIVFGMGTFGPAICLLSDEIEMVFFFWNGEKSGFNMIPSVKRAFEVIDEAGKYIKRGEWKNAPEQREMMIEYPTSNLKFSWPSR